jgi:hypothetical protein
MGRSNVMHVPHQRTREEALAEAERIGHELIERARAAHASMHPHLALEQLEAELELAAHLALDVKRLLGK